MMLRAICLVVFLPFAALAQDLPVPLSDTVSDFADLLPPDREAEVSALIQAIRDETGVHVAVATMDRISNYGSGTRSIASYATALFNAWGIGDPARNDGILMLVAAEDREVRIALGSAYDAVYDGRAQRVIDTAILPAFKTGAMAEGILAGVQSTRDRLVTPFLAGKPITVDEGFPSTSIASYLILGGAGLVGAGLIGVRSRLRAQRRCPKCGNQTLVRSKDLVKPATSVSAGNGIEHITCSSCGFNERRPYTVSAGSNNDRSGGKRGGGSGGSGGFGGGRSSGGGATGRW
jgi:uncharacterized protein